MCLRLTTWSVLQSQTRYSKMFPQRTRRQFVRGQSCQLSGKPELPVDLEGYTALLAPRYASAILSWGKLEKPVPRVKGQKCRSREQFLTFGIVLDGSLLRKHLSFLCVIFTSSFLVLLLWFQHSQLGRILPEDVSVIDPQGSRRDLHILIKTITECNFRANKAHQPTGHDHSRWVEACLVSYKSSTTQPPTDRLCM